MRRRWTTRGVVVMAGLALVWVGTGVGVYLGLGAHRSGVARGAARPDQSGAGISPELARLRGTLYVVQEGALYRLQRGRFTAVLPAGGWIQPALVPNGQGLVLVKRDPAGFSDLYRLDGAGHLLQLTSNSGQGAVQGLDPGSQTVTQYWAMFPQVSADATQLYFVTDRYKHLRCCPFDVTMRVAAMPVAGGTTRFWTVDAVTPSDPHTQDGDYAGGDAEPVPLASGAVLFVRYALMGRSIGSQLMLLRQARATPAPLTAAGDHCEQPALSPAADRVAMVCSYGKEAASLEVAAFDGTSLGPRQVLVSGAQAAQPVWSPDGSRLIFLAPAGLSGRFQLWSAAAPATLPAPTPPPRPSPARARALLPSASPSETPLVPAEPVRPPLQLTANLDFDATSTIAWAGS